MDCIALVDVAKKKHAINIEENCFHGRLQIFQVYKHPMTEFRMLKFDHYHPK